MTSSATLTVHRCIHDGRLVIAGDEACPECGRTDFEPAEVSGQGQVVVWTTIHVAPTRYQGEAPYTVAMVELEGGLRAMGRLQGNGARELGARVKLSSVDPQRGPTFEPA